MTLMKVSNDICESQRIKHKISVITQNAKWYQQQCLLDFKTKQLTNFFSLLTMPPQGQMQGLSYKDQDQDLGGKDQDKDKD